MVDSKWSQLIYPIEKGVTYVILKESIKPAWDDMHGMTFRRTNQARIKIIEIKTSLGPIESTS